MELLDDIKIEKAPVHRRYALMSLWCAVINIVAFVIMLILIIYDDDSGNEESILFIASLVFYTIIMLCSSFGLLVSIISYAKKENDKLVFWIGTLVNLLFFAIIVVSLIFGNAE